MRNIQATPRVRVKVRGTWRSGTAHTLLHDDPQERLRKIGLRFNGALVQTMGTDLLTVQIDLLAAYVATSPQYQLPKRLTGEAAPIAEELRRRIPDRPVTTTSTVTYVVAARP